MQLDPVFLQYLSQNLQKDEKVQKVYFDYLDKNYGKISENHNGFPVFANEGQRRNFQITLDSTVRAYRSGLLTDDASTTVSTGTTNANLGIPRILPPMLRRIMPNLFANQICNVQSITAPDAKVFFYKTSKLGSSGTALGEIGDKDTFDRTYADLGEGLVAKNISFEFSSSSLTATTKKLAAEWTLELQIAANAYMNLNVENEMVIGKADEIRLELEGGILNHMASSATAGNVNFYLIPPAGDTTSTAKRDYAKGIYKAIVQANSLIYKKCYVNATWIVAGADACAKIEELEEFKIDTESTNTMALSRQKMGVLAGKWVVYKDPFFVDSLKMLLGFKSSDREFYAGFIFAPFVPAYLTATVISPTTFKFAKGLMSWNGQIMLKGDMFATVTLINTQEP